MSDRRLEGYCIYCGGEPETREHVPSKILLEKPYPDNLPVVLACIECNHSFSLHEEYFACLLECILCGTTEPEYLNRISIAKILNRKTKLRSQLEKARKIEDGQIYFQPENDRIVKLIKKLAQGHAKYENSETQFEEPVSLWYKPSQMLPNEEVEHFFKEDEVSLVPEVGSRGFQRMRFNPQGVPLINWKTVQDNIYYYSVANVPGVRVRMYIWNYLLAEVRWE